MLEPKLTKLTSGGGCGCKISPEILSEILAKTRGISLPPELLVGNNTSDDAAVYKLDAQRALVATTDFFTPIVDDPADFGAISATNALSDVYAMGAKPIFALAIAGMPVSVLTTTTISKIFTAGKDICERAGIPIVGGHTIDSQEPIYGLVCIGLVETRNLKKNSTAKIKDKLILGKPLGVGVYSAALKKNKLRESEYKTFIKYATQLNWIGYKLGAKSCVNAMTDITGFGLLGHLVEIASGSNVTIQLETEKVIFHPQVISLAKEGYLTGASTRNWESISSKVEFRTQLNPTEKSLLTDPQTSGGLLVSVCSENSKEILELFLSNGYTAFEIGSVTERNQCEITIV